MGEISVAVLRCSEDMRIKIDFPELDDVVDDYEVGVKVYDALHGGGEEVREVDTGVVEWLVECAADGDGDFVSD